MRCCIAICLLMLTGCSNAPLAGFLDWIAPAKMLPPNTPTVGGVNNQPSPPPGATLAPPETALPGQPVPLTR